LATYREDETGCAYSASLPDSWSLSIRADQRHRTRARNNEADIAPSACACPETTALCVDTLERAPGARGWRRGGRSVRCHGA